VDRFTYHIYAVTCPPSLSLFCFYGSLHLLALPSFPTRRSSDLPRPGALYGPGAARRYGGDPGVAVVLLQEPDDPPEALPRARPLDRKSTRLNSSHRTISYAVFCLKKKKKHRSCLRALMRLTPSS